MSGSFGSVFQLDHGSECHAVKCFYNGYADQRERFRCILECLCDARLKCAVDFDYSPDGILIHGSRYPILKMDWVDGITLDRYVSGHLRSPRSLRALTKQFQSLARKLKSHHIAHGDLQHGNILVAEDQLKLIVYDGMYVPKLRGLSGNETGHPNYQCPDRRREDFDESMVEFSIAVIYASLLELARSPRPMAGIQWGRGVSAVPQTRFSVS